MGVVLFAWLGLLVYLSTSFNGSWLYKSFRSSLFIVIKNLVFASSAASRIARERNFDGCHEDTLKSPRLHVINGRLNFVKLLSTTLVMPRTSLESLRTSGSTLELRKTPIVLCNSLNRAIVSTV